MDFRFLFDYTGPNQFGIKKFFLLPFIFSPVVSMYGIQYLLIHLSSVACSGKCVGDDLSDFNSPMKKN